MPPAISILLDAIDAGREAACCRVIETRGSTPQKAGATMLVFPDGSQAGTLGGGCVEAEVKRRALASLAENQPAVETFQLDDDYGWDDGLVCGGRMRVLIEPTTDPQAADYYRRLGQAAQEGAGATEAVVFDGPAGGPEAPASYLFDDAGQLLARLRGASGREELDALRGGLRPLESRPRPSTSQGVAYLPLLPRRRLLIVGGGHIGKAVADLAAELEFDVWVADDREEYVDAKRFPQAQRRLCGPIGQVLKELDITPATYCLIVTRGHRHDEEALYHLADRGAGYVGMIGSRRKIQLIFDDLLQEGVRPEALDRVFAPVGIDIGSQTAAEIAVSICAELVACRNLGNRTPKRSPPRSTSRPA